METNQIARATVTINAPVQRVWDALVNPAAIKQYMFGTTVNSDWQEGSPITWKGEWQGKAYEDRGKILQVEPGRLLEYTHVSGGATGEEHQHTVTVMLSGEGKLTRLTLAQDNNSSDEAREESEKNWTVMLEGLKKYVER